MRRPSLAARVSVLAWRVVPRLPPPVAHTLFAAVADALWLRRGAGVRQLEANLARVVPGGGAGALRALSRAGMRSYLRYWCDAFAMATWSRERLLSGVRMEGAEPLREAVRTGRGATFFVGHCGNWDHLGAWAALDLVPVTTVVERLEPPEVFEAFLAHRRSLGITALPHTGAGTATALVRALAAGGVVPLVADRDLTGSGVEVSLFGEPARVASGPAVLALATGAVLFAVTCHDESTGAPWWRAQRHTVVARLHEVPVPPRAKPGQGGAGGLAAARARQVQEVTQACVTVLERGIAAHPQDWHMLQPVFTADIEARPSRRLRGRRGRRG